MKEGSSEIYDGCPVSKVICVDRNFYATARELSDCLYMNVLFICCTAFCFRYELSSFSWSHFFHPHDVSSGIWLSLDLFLLQQDIKFSLLKKPKSFAVIHVIIETTSWLLRYLLY